jgi:hypothetical protein
LASIARVDGFIGVEYRSLRVGVIESGGENPHHPHIDSKA